MLKLQEVSNSILALEKSKDVDKDSLIWIYKLFAKDLARASVSKIMWNETYDFVSILDVSELVKLHKPEVIENAFRDTLISGLYSSFGESMHDITKATSYKEFFDKLLNNLNSMEYASFSTDIGITGTVNEEGYTNICMDAHMVMTNYIQVELNKLNKDN